VDLVLGLWSLDSSCSYCPSYTFKFVTSYHGPVPFNVPVAIYVNWISLNIKDNWKIIAISQDDQWLSKY
jgi:hypothetical protein